jgi:hypothetical protein
MATQLKCEVLLPPISENKHSGRDYRECLYYRLPHTNHIPPYEIALDAFTPWTPQISSVPILLRGYFQYLPTIEPVMPTVCTDLLNYLTQQREMLRNKYALQDLSTIGFIHVRRGDYLTAPAGFNSLDYKVYYDRAKMQAPILSRWLILSDDVTWCKTNLPDEIIDEPDELVGLALMSLCHGGAIIANSTYSWWGAMLGAHPARAPVIYPLQWLNDAHPIIFHRTWIGC